MSKATAIKDALKAWEEKNGQEVATAKEVGLQFQWPPIEKMDNSLAALVECRKLSLSTNMIEKISGIGTMKNLRVLSLARNQLKNLNGIEALGENLEELWVSYNNIEKLKPIESMKVLKVFYIMHNLIKDWVEFNRIALAPKLEELSFMGNALQESNDETFRNDVMKRLPNLKKLDGEPIIRND